MLSQVPLCRLCPLMPFRFHCNMSTVGHFCKIGFLQIILFMINLWYSCRHQDQLQNQTLCVWISIKKRTGAFQSILVNRMYVY